MNETPSDTNLKPVPWFLRTINKDCPVISREGFYRKLKSGELPSYKFGSKILVNPQEILAAMRQGATMEERER